MRYTFKIANGPEVIVAITDKRPTQLVADDGKHNGVMPSWVYNDYEVKPTTAWVVNVGEPDFAEPLPERDDEQSIDMFAWQGVQDSNGATDAILVEWPDGTVELSLPEHDVSGTEGAPTPVERLREMVIENRLCFSFGDGMERDYAEAGRVDLGMNVNEMTRDELERELDGEIPMPTPTAEQWETARAILGDEDTEAWARGDCQEDEVKTMNERIAALQAVLNHHYHLNRGAR